MIFSFLVPGKLLALTTSVLEATEGEIRQEKEINFVSTEKEKVKWLLLVGNITIYVENPRRSPKTTRTNKETIFWNTKSIYKNQL